VACVQAACAGLTLVGAFFVYNMVQGKSLDAAASDLKVRSRNTKDFECSESCAGASFP